jgi:hypothetical protein
MRIRDQTCCWKAAFHRCRRLIGRQRKLSTAHDDAATPHLVTEPFNPLTCNLTAGGSVLSGPANRAKRLQPSVTLQHGSNGLWATGGLGSQGFATFEASRVRASVADDPGV